jgi:cytochrome c
MPKHIAQRLAVTGLVVVLLVASGEAQQAQPPLGLGHTPTTAEIQAWDIAIGPDGKELPPGQGTVRAGATLYREKCAMCHGETGREGPQDVLVGGQGSLVTAKPVRTIGSFWPYATTIYDYVWRAMPFYAPGSLTPDEVYSLTAYLLYLNGIIGENEAINAQTLPQIRMPNRAGFQPDPRPDVGGGVNSLLSR